MTRLGCLAVLILPAVLRGQIDPADLIQRARTQIVEDIATTAEAQLHSKMSAAPSSYSKLPSRLSSAIRNGREEQIPTQLGSDLRTKNTGEIEVDNPELELAEDPEAADALLAYKVNRNLNEHGLRVLEPVAGDRQPRVDRRDDWRTDANMYYASFTFSIE